MDVSHWLALPRNTYRLSRFKIDLELFALECLESHLHGNCVVFRTTALCRQRKRIGESPYKL